MDAADLDLYERSLRHATERHTGAALDVALDELGWSELLDVDPGILHLPPSRDTGADPGKLQRQIARHGKSTAGMPLIAS